jgi:nucleoside-diphosphate-sugar epimerase
MPARGALNSSDARHHLKWKPVIDLETGIEKTIDWMRPWAENNVSI